MAQENGHGDGSAIEFLRRDSELDAMPKGQGVTMLTQRHERWRSKDYHVLPVGVSSILFKAAQ